MSEKLDIKNKAASGIFWKGLERVSAEFVSTVVAIILARILMPEDYSVVSIVAIFFAFCNVFISGGLNTALIQKKDADIVDYSTILITNLFFASVLYVAMFFTAPLIARLYKKELLVPVIRVMALTFFINGIKAVVSAKVTSELKFRKFFLATFIGTAVSAVVGIVMAVKGFGAWALVAQQMTNAFIDTLLLWISSKYRFVFKFSKRKFKSLFGYGGKLMLSSITDTVYNQVKPLIVGIRFSAVDLAYYNKGENYPKLISQITSDTLSSSLFPVMSKIQDDKERVLSMTRRFMQISSYLIFPMMLGFLAVAEKFTVILLTEKWLPIVPFLIIFCISHMFKPIQASNLQAIRAIGRSDMILKLEIIKKTCNYVIILLFVLFSDSPVLLAISGIITAVLASAINMTPNRKLIGYGYRMQIIDLLPNFLTAAVMCTAVYFMNYIQMNVYLLFVLQVFTGAAIYLILSLITKNKNLFYLFDYAKDLLSKIKKGEKTEE